MAKVTITKVSAARKNRLIRRWIIGYVFAINRILLGVRSLPPRGPRGRGAIIKAVARWSRLHIQTACQAPQYFSLSEDGAEAQHFYQLSSWRQRRPCRSAGRYVGRTLWRRTD